MPVCPSLGMFSVRLHRVPQGSYRRKIMFFNALSDLFLSLCCLFHVTGLRIRVTDGVVHTMATEWLQNTLDFSA